MSLAEYSHDAPAIWFGVKLSWETRNAGLASINGEHEGMVFSCVLQGKHINIRACRRARYLENRSGFDAGRDLDT